MKAVIEKVTLPVDYSFSTEQVSTHSFVSKWHFHEKLEIIYIYDCSGNGFVGDGSAFFNEGVLSIIGSGVPHVWQNSKEYYEPGSRKIAKSIIIKFEEEFMGEKFLNLPGMLFIKDLLQFRSKRGILFSNHAKEKISQKLRELVKTKSDFERVTLLIQILNIMATTKDFKYISSAGYTRVTKTADFERLNKVYKYVLDNFQEKIELNEIAQVANLSPSAFCKYFKSRTLKTFTRFLNEVRIGHACKLLMNVDVNVNQACYMSGFKYLSNFYKQFHAIHNVTPLEYKRRFFESEINSEIEMEL